MAVMDAMAAALCHLLCARGCPLEGFESLLVPAWTGNVQIFSLQVRSL